ncbi:MAG: cytochrome P450, partial [Steroidobacteraceae bacterium]
IMQTDIVRLGLDPFAEDNLRYPHAMQRTLLAAGPVFWLERYETYGVARHSEVLQVLQDPQHFISSAGIGLAHLRKPGAWRAPSPIAEADPPQHDIVRKAMNRIVAPSVVSTWREGFLQRANALCDEVLAAREVDGVKDLAEAYVHDAFPSALGVESHRENLLIIGHHSANAAGPQNALFKQSQAELDGIMDWYQHHQSRAGMIPGGFGAQVFEAEERGDIPNGLAGPMLRTLVRGGLDTTISGLASTLWYLASNPAQWSILKRNPKLVGAAFEEALRLESPTSSIYRTTTEEARVGDVPLLPDTKVQVFVGASNRDPRKWVDAEDFNIERSLGGHIGFGSGIHFCLGQRIAKLEAECFLSVFLERVAELEIAGPVEFRAVNVLRAIESLPLRVRLH